MKIIIEPSAKLDLFDIQAFIAKDNPYRAKSFVEELTLSALKIADFPKAYPLYFPRNKHIRYKPYGNYAIFYTLQGNTIIILRFLHLKRRIKLKDLL